MTAPEGSLDRTLWRQPPRLVPHGTRYDVRITATMAFLLSSAALIFLSLPLPGYIRASWVLPFTTIGVICLALTGLQAWLASMSGWRAVSIILFADVAIVVAVAALSDRDAGQIVASLMVLPTLFVAMFMRVRWLMVQVAAATACSWVIVGLTDPTPGVHALRTLILLVSAICPAAIVIVLRTRLDQAADHAQELATTDPLTGLLNRRGLEQHLPALAARAARMGTLIAVVVADVDHFKRVNDQHGHLVGDQVLREVAAAVSSCVRADDLVVRLGGEELMVAAALDVAGVHHLAQRIREHVAQTMTSWGVTVSVGAAGGRPSPDQAPPDLLWNLVGSADNLMFEAKRDGRNQVRIATTLPTP